jgi:hypothetical protein
MNKLAIIAIAALVIGTAVVAIAQQNAFAGSRDRDVNQEGRCGSCQQNQATDNDDSLNTDSEARDTGDADASGNGGSGDRSADSGSTANGGQFNSR